MTFDSHHALAPHHRYQLEVIFLFVFGFFLFIPYHIFLEEYGLPTIIWQWYFFWPWMIFYIIYSLRTRRTITRKEAAPPLKRPIGHWILLGLSLIAFHERAAAETLQSLDLMFGIFSLFLADSYWDFQTIRVLTSHRA